MTVLINIRPNPAYIASKILDGNAYRFRFWWNIQTSKWYMSITGLNNTVSIKSVALVPGHELIGKYGYSDILGQLHVIDNQGANEDPNFDDIGSRWTLEYTPLPVRAERTIIASQIMEVPIYIQILGEGNATDFANAFSAGFVQGQDVTWQVLYALGNSIGNVSNNSNSWGISRISINDAISSDPIVIAANEIATFNENNINVIGQG
jgi:hypothetical protein